MRIIPLFGSGIAGKSFVVTRQRRLNCYFEVRQDGDKTKVAVYGTAGLVAKFRPTTPATVALRGLLGTQDMLYVIGFDEFQSIDSSGNALFTASLATSSGLASLANNATQVVIVDGAAAYLYTPSAATFVTIGGGFPPGARTVTFVASFFVAEQPGTQQFWVSNTNDGSTWDPLAFASASAFADTILAVDNLSGVLLIFSQQHMEFWQNVGAAPEPFAPILSAANEYGLAAIFSRSHLDQSIIFLAQTRTGQVQFVQIQGLTASIISNADLDSIINGFAIVSDAVGMAYEVDQHKFYQCTFASANRSFLFDTASGLWSEVQTGVAAIPSRHWGNLSTYYAGYTLISDYLTNQIYTISSNQFTDNGQTIIRELITRHVLSNFNRIRISSLYLDMETGVGLQSGQGSNPQVMLTYSKDNGRTWSGERWASVGRIGEYLTRLIWRRFGSTRDATWKIRMSDPVKFVITEGAIKLQEREQ